MSISISFGILAHRPELQSLSEKSNFLKAFAKLGLSFDFAECVNVGNEASPQMMEVRIRTKSKKPEMESKAIVLEANEQKKWLRGAISVSASTMDEIGLYSIYVPNADVKLGTKFIFPGDKEQNNLGTLDAAIDRILELQGSGNGREIYEDLLQTFKTANQHNWILSLH